MFNRILNKNILNKNILNKNILNRNILNENRNIKIKNDIINITDNAWNKIDNILNHNINLHNFYFSIDSGGCNGFNYVFTAQTNHEFNNFINNNKLNINYTSNNNNNVYIDPLSEMFIIGTTIDYIEDIYESKFIYKPNKNIANSCGCGISFSLK